MNNNKKINTKLWQEIEKITGNIFSEINNNNWGELLELLCHRNNLIKEYFENYTQKNLILESFLEQEKKFSEIIDNKKDEIKKEFMKIQTKNQCDLAYKKINNLLE